MPTGYTADVGDGKLTELADFALTCARGWSPLVRLRDSDRSLEATRRLITEEAHLETGEFYRRELEVARAKIRELQALTGDEALTAAQVAADQVIASNRDHEAKRTRTQENYEAMIAKVEAWVPPTGEHAEFKQFMLRQLRESLSFDCGSFEFPVPEVNAGWRDAEIERQQQRISRYTDELAKQQERNAYRRAWVSALVDSLEAVPA